jgi:electron transfer flavoprotein alpha subunit
VTEAKMDDILALVEHRQGSLRDITYEVMACGRDLAGMTGARLTALILGENPAPYAEAMKRQADRVLVVDSPVFKHFNSASYQRALVEIVRNEKPRFILMGHSAFGMDLGPSLAVELDLPFTTDCIGVSAEGGRVKVTRQVYDGKLNATVELREGPSYLLTLRSGTFPADEPGLEGEVTQIRSPIDTEPDYRRFIEYVEPPAGDIDITRSDIVVGVGRGVKDKENLAIVEEFASSLGAVVGCTRPIVDNEWLPKSRQVGSSGKTIKPKLYIALGISGAFQHLAGMKGADTIIAVNKDANAPIFNEADYGVVDDMFKILPALKERILELKG